MFLVPCRSSRHLVAVTALSLVTVAHRNTARSNGTRQTRAVVTILTIDSPNSSGPSQQRAMLANQFLNCCRIT